MRWLELSRQAGDALLQHKLRSLLSTLGIVFAVAAVVSMLAVAEGARRVTLEQIGRLGARNVIVRKLALSAEQRAAARERLSRGLTAEDATALARAIPTAEAVAPVREVAAAVGALPPDEQLDVLAVGASYAETVDLTVRLGRFLLPVDLEERSQVCVLGAESALLLGDAGLTGAQVRIADRLFHVVGILREQRPRESGAAVVASRDYSRSVLIPLGSEPEEPAGRAGEERGGLAEIIVRVREGASVEATAATVRAVLARLHGGVEDFQVVIPRELLRQAQRTQGIFNWVLGCIAGISLLVGGIGIMNIMLASVAERTREVGLRRAVGASRGQVVLQFLAETALLTASGGCLGAAAGGAAAAVITALAGWATALTWWALGLALAMAVGVGLLAGLYPALRAAWLDPLAALRQE